MKLDSTKKLRPGQIILAIIALLCAIFLLRVAVWEKDYYTGMEGSERAVAIDNLGDESPIADETEITPEAKVEYQVAPYNPRYLSIAKLGIDNARILSLGINSKGALATPSNIYDAGWYNASSRPGAGGTVVLDGHNGGPTKEGIFKYLPDLIAGDLITIEIGNGTIYTYQVVENLQVPLADATAYMTTAMTSPVPGTESVTIISCSGSWDSAAKTYNSRQFVRAIRI